MGSGLYEQDGRGKWWPTSAAIEAGFLPCRSCERTGGKAAIVATPKDPGRVAAFIASHGGRSLDRDELATLLRDYPDREWGRSSPSDDMRTVVNPGQFRLTNDEKAPIARTGVPKAQVIGKLLELRAREAPLGFSGYRGVLTQKAIAEVAGVRVRDVTKAAFELEQELGSAATKTVGDRAIPDS